MVDSLPYLRVSSKYSTLLFRVHPLTDGVSYIQVCSSLFVCNLPIIVPLFCRILSCGGSKLNAHRTLDWSLDLQSHGNSDAPGL